MNSESRYPAGRKPEGRKPERPAVLRRLAIGFGAVLGAYLVVRGIAEFFVIDYGDPSSYRPDWGGPSLAGVFAVHTGPALVILGWVGYRLRRRVVGAGAGAGHDDRSTSRNRSDRDRSGRLTVR